MGAGAETWQQDRQGRTGEPGGAPPREPTPLQTGSPSRRRLLMVKEGTALAGTLTARCRPVADSRAPTPNPCPESSPRLSAPTTVLQRSARSRPDAVQGLHETNGHPVSPSGWCWCGRDPLSRPSSSLEAVIPCRGHPARLQPVSPPETGSWPRRRQTRPLGPAQRPTPAVGRPRILHRGSCPGVRGATRSTGHADLQRPVPVPRRRRPRRNCTPHQQLRQVCGGQTGGRQGRRGTPNAPQRVYVHDTAPRRQHRSPGSPGSHGPHASPGSHGS